MRMVVLASRNRDKLRELREILASVGVEAAALPETAPEVEETGATFFENAALKALSAYRATGLPSVADDSGLCVDALGGGPGVLSARYAGPNATNDANNERLVHDLRGVADRAAHYHCAIALVCRRSDLALPAPGVHESWPGLPDDAVLVESRGRVDGVIVDTPHGTGGFGYDPHFFLPELGRTFAEIPADEKHALSHRGRALRDLSDFLRSYAR